MTGTAPVVTLSPRDYDAVLFDMDGVLSNTASVHAAAWKRLFDEFLEQRAADTDEAFAPFDIEADYRRYVDGKPRYDGVAVFLKARGIEAPWGALEDPLVIGVDRSGQSQALRQAGADVVVADLA